MELQIIAACGMEPGKDRLIVQGSQRSGRDYRRAGDTRSEKKFSSRNAMFNESRVCLVRRYSLVSRCFLEGSCRVVFWLGYKDRKSDQIQ